MAITNGLGQTKVGVRATLVQAQTTSLLLDTYSGAAAAYSLRKLSGTYTGSAIRVRRSSDNTEQNIGFDAGGNLNTVALLAFVGSGNGFVKTWYDQSGNDKNAQQTSASNQPKIVSNGSVIYDGGFPSIQFSSSRLEIGTQIDLRNQSAIFFLGRSVGTNVSYAALLNYNSNPNDQPEFRLGLNSGIAIYWDSTYLINGVTTDLYNRKIFSFLVTGTSNRSFSFYSNKSQLVTGSKNTVGFSPVSEFSMGGYIRTGGYQNGFLQEMIVYSTDKSLDRNNIENSMNSYYSIYASDTDAQAFISAAGITDGTQKTAINTLVTDLKTAGIWTKMKALYPFVGGTSNSHKFNLKDPRDSDAAYRLVFGGGWIHSNTGALPNASNTYADTKLIPNSVLTLNSTHLSFYSRTNSAISGADFGASLTNPCMNMFTKWTDNNAYHDHYSSGSDRLTFSMSGISTSAFFISTRTTNTSLKVYRNGNQIGVTTVNQNINSLPTSSIWISAHNSNGSYSRPSNRETAFASIGDGLTDAEALTFYNAVQAFQTTLGRAV